MQKDATGRRFSETDNAFDIHSIGRASLAQLFKNKVRLKVLPEQLTLFVIKHVCDIQKRHHSIVFYDTILIIAKKYTLFHIPVMKNIIKGLK